jgi:hypothetical protein
VQLLVVVLNKVEKLDDLLLELSDNGIRGGTIIDTMGMIKTLANDHSEIPLFGSLKSLLNEDRPINKTIFMVLPDEKIPIAMSCVRRIVPDLDKKNKGIMFTLPVIKAEGLTK